MRISSLSSHSVLVGRVLCWHLHILFVVTSITLACATACHTPLTRVRRPAFLSSGLTAADQRIFHLRVLRLGCASLLETITSENNPKVIPSCEQSILRSGTCIDPSFRPVLLQHWAARGIMTQYMAPSLRPYDLGLQGTEYHLTSMDMDTISQPPTPR